MKEEEGDDDEEKTFLTHLVFAAGLGADESHLERDPVLRVVSDDERDARSLPHEVL